MKEQNLDFTFFMIALLNAAFETGIQRNLQARYLQWRLEGLSQPELNLQLKTKKQKKPDSKVSLGFLLRHFSAQNQMFSSTKLI